MRRFAVILSAVALVAAFPGMASADHDPPDAIFPVPGAPAPNQGGGEWEIISSFFTQNPHTDLDFFTQDGVTYAAVGTLGVGFNRGGQTIVKLTDAAGNVDGNTIEYVSGHPSATCIADESRALGLQHDVEATPKGSAALGVPTNTTDATRVMGDAQLLVDATDARGRCHDQGTLFGFTEAPLGGLEIIDITEIDNPVEIALTSHIGEAHTVNIDPRRPHIAYVVSSDSVPLDGEGKRTNEVEGGSNRFRLDGFEVVDMSSCMDFPADTETNAKRGFDPGTETFIPDEGCRPEVYRYRWPTVEMALGHHNRNTVYGCHELEIYPDDRLTCGGGAAMMLFDMAGAFEERGGGPRDEDPTNDKPAGDPLPCEIRASSNSGAAAAYRTDAPVIDCVREGQGDAELSIPEWIQDGEPSLEGVEYLGSAHHQGRQATGGDFTSPAYGSAEDIDFDHEAELTHSGDFVIATDERGGGVLPPGASCAPAIDNPVGNGGLHTYKVGDLETDINHAPDEAEEAWQAYARTPEGDKAIARAPIHTQPQGSTCTAHVFQQLPGQNRIFMGWYSQGTQVFDYRENDDGTFEWAHVAYFIPSLPTPANQWTSHVFKMEENDDDTVTYYGVAGDFLLGTGPGRNAIDVWKATLPAVGSTFDDAGGGGGGGGGGDEGGAGDAPDALPATGGSLAIPGALALLGAAAVFGRARRRRTA